MTGASRLRQPRYLDHLPGGQRAEPLGLDVLLKLLTPDS
jgi:hypothetical protein